MKAVIFARVSTQEQAQEGYSIGGQVERLTEYCKRNNLDVIEVFKVSESSTKGEKKEFNRMINLVKTHKDKIAIVVDKVDRLNRSVSDLPKLEELLNTNKGELHFLDIGRLDNEANTVQKLMLRIMTAIGNTYNDNLSDHGKRTYMHKVTNGECPRKAPLGYLNVEENGKKTVIVDKLRATLIKKMFEMYALGKTSLGDLEKFAAENGLTNNFFSHSETKTLSKNVISCLLKDPFYCGFIKCKKQNDKLYPHKYERLITQQLFDECQKINEERCKANNRHQSIQTAKEGKQFIFKSLIKCGTTGRVVTSDRKERGNKTFTHLMVWNPENPKKKIWVNENEVLEKIENVFKSMVIPKEMLEQIRTHLQGLHDDEKDYYKARIDDLNRRLALAHSKYDRLIDMNLEGSITGDIFAKKDKELKEEMANLKTDIAMNDIADEKFKTLVITVLELATQSYELFLYATLSEKRSLIDFVFSDITLTGRNLNYTLRKPFDLIVDLSKCEDWLPE
jgi:site-specific DNA recombinase